MMIGQIESHYKIVDKPDAGRMCGAYRAQGLKVRRFVALRFFHPDFGAEENQTLTVGDWNQSDMLQLTMYSVEGQNLCPLLGEEVLCKLKLRTLMVPAS